MREIGAQMTELLCHSIKNHRELRPGSAPLGKAFLTPVERRARNPCLRFLGNPKCARARATENSKFEAGVPSRRPGLAPRPLTLLSEDSCRQELALILRSM